MSGNASTRADDSVLNIKWDLISNYVGLGIAWSPDGKQIVFTNGKDTLYILDIRTQQARQLFKTRSDIKYAYPISVEWSPDGQFIAVALSNLAYIIKPDTGEILQTLPKAKTDHLESQYVNEVHWMADSAHLITFDLSGYVRIFDVQTGELTKDIDLVGKQIDTFWDNSFAWSSDSNLFAARNFQSASMWFWNKNGELLTQYVTHSWDDVSKPSCKLKIADYEQIYKLGWAKGGHKLAVATGYKLIICTLNDYETLSYRLIEPELDETKVGVYWSADGRWLMSNIQVSSDKTDCALKIYDSAQDYKLIQTLQDKQPCYSFLVWSPDNHYIAAGNSGGLWLGTVQS